MDVITSRNFDNEKDIPKLQTFLAKMRRTISQASYFHLGDIVFRMNKLSNNFDMNKDIRIWEEAGLIVGFVLYITPEYNPELQINPDYYNTNLPDDMLNWTIKRATELDQDSIEVSCIDIDKNKKDFLKSRSFNEFDDPMVFMEMDLNHIPEIKPPADYSFVTVNDYPDNLQITGDEKSNDENKKIVSTNEFKDDLGIRVIYKHTRIVSGCICWYDNIDKCGLFEPVGTVEDHRGLGLAFSVMVKTLVNLSNYGAKKAFVRTDADNIPAIKLYKKVGFHITNYDNGLVLEIKK